MSLHVLQQKVQINSARKELINEAASAIDSPLRALLRRFGVISGMAVGGKVKSWDVLSTLNFIKQKVAKDEPILDIGCYASEVIVALYKTGYSHLVGVDLNPNLQKMPYQDSIRYEISNFMHTNFADASFQAITSISVIEHGFDGPAFLKEISRLLKPCGYFIASFDYWPEKIDTTGIKIFAMDWKIFSKDEITNFITEASGYGLFPVGELIYEAKDKIIDSGDKQYTFAWMVLEKRILT